MFRILLVEDNEGDVFLIKEAFKEASFKGDIIVTRDGEEAVQYLEKVANNQTTFPIDLVLLDINLPKKNGHDVLRYIKTTEYLKHIPVVMLTTSSSQSDIFAAYSNFASSYITKPMEVDDFQEMISKIANYWFAVTQLPKAG